MTYNTKTGKEKYQGYGLQQEQKSAPDYNNSSRRFRPWGSRVMALSIKCDSLACEEKIFSSGINCIIVLWSDSLLRIKLPKL